MCAEFQASLACNLKRRKNLVNGLRNWGGGVGGGGVGEEGEGVCY